jgi:hypothetical protein
MFGTGLGAILAAMTGDATYFAVSGIGLALGLGLGAAFDGSRKEHSDGGREP